jgi:membrane-bound lytic murein transglycosylase A
VSSEAESPGWQTDAPAELLAAYAETVPPGWPRPDGPDDAAFFRRAFRALPPVGPGLMTGYYEPELAARLAPDATYRFPLHTPPPAFTSPWFTRAEIETRGHLTGHEIVWVASALDAFLAQVQGSVRARLPDGSVLRLGYAGKNGHPYTSIGQELVRRREVPQDRISVPAIRAWCAANPDRMRDLLWSNASYVFFRILDLPPDLPPDLGPVGAAGAPVTPLRSIAVDPDLVPLGAPVWVDAPGQPGFPRLTVAQDTGSAIKGPGRADLFCGSGDVAGERAGGLAAPCHLTVLLPRGDVP